MLKKASIPWTVNTLVKQIDKGNIDFNYAVQRGLVWENNKKSLLIHSMVDDYPIPAFYFVKDENGRYGALDGKQRSDAIEGYVNGRYILGDVPSVFDDDGKEYDISGMEFQQLPGFAQDAIKGYSLTIYYFENITEDEVAEMFFRLNNGKALTAIELTRVKAKSLSIFQEISKHPAINFAISEKGKKGYHHELLAMQMWAICFAVEPSLNTKEFRPMIVDVDVTDEEKCLLTTCLNLINALYKHYNPEDKKDKKMLKKFKARTHFVSLVYLAKLCIAKSHESKFIDLANEFFSGLAGASIDDDYNEAAGRSSAKRESVNNRIEAIQNFVELKGV